jgi:hypothetical protein
MFDDTLNCKIKGCTNNRVTKRYCRDCQNQINKKSKEQRLERKRRGQCRQCNVKRMKTSSYCLYHYMKKIATKTTHDTSIGPALYKKYLDQHKQCYYTGLPIELGVNASIDHVHCQSRHGFWKSDIRNMVWTTKKLNSAKTDLDLGEFLRICELVAFQATRIRREYGKNT